MIVRQRRSLALSCFDPPPTFFRKDEVAVGRLRAELLGLRVEASLLRFVLLHRKSNPDQPRIPAGESGGGRWTDDGTEPSSAFDTVGSPIRRSTSSRETGCSVLRRRNFVLGEIEMQESEIDREIMKIVETNLYEISGDEIGVGLCGIVWDGRRVLHLEGAPLVEFVRRVVAGIAAGGATPEDGSSIGSDDRRGLAHFGADTPQEIADGVVAAWVAKGMPDPEWGDWRFNTAENRAALDELSGRDSYSSPAKGWRRRRSLEHAVAGGVVPDAPSHPRVHPPPGRHPCRFRR